MTDNLDVMLLFMSSLVAPSWYAKADPWRSRTRLQNGSEANENLNVMPLCDAEPCSGKDGTGTSNRLVVFEVERPKSSSLS